jgi:predicted RNA polymerase sigma factor
LRRAGRNADAAAAYHAAIDRCENATEKEFLRAQYRSLARN